MLQVPRVAWHFEIDVGTMSREGGLTAEPRLHIAADTDVDADVWSKSVD